MMMSNRYTQQESSTIILACDPGYDRLGIAIMEGNVHSPKLLYSTCLVTDKNTTQAKRLFSLYTTLLEIITTYSPKHIALEKLFISNNTASVLKVAEARGMLLTLATIQRLNVIEHSPQEVKLAVTGYGSATKKDVISMTKRLIPGIQEGALDDEYDAVALALCALTSYKRNPQTYL